MRGIRAIAATGILTALIGCGHVFVLSHVKSRDEMLSRASHVLIAVIDNHEFASWPLFRVSLPGEYSGVYPDAERHAGEAKYWKVLRRRIRVEAVLRGIERRKIIDLYEVFWTGGASGDWNSTHDGERAVFLLRVEHGYYHVVQDWWRSIFSVTSGPHTLRRLPKVTHLCFPNMTQATARRAAIRLKAFDELREA